MICRFCLILGFVVGAPVSAVAAPPPTEAVTCPDPQSNEVIVRLSAEENCLSQLPGIAWRSGNTLEIRLKDGSTKTFTSNYQACERGDAGKCIQYWLAAYHPRQQSLVLTGRGYESSRAFLVSVATGNVTLLEGEPHFSPSGLRFVVVKASESEDFENHIAIYSTASEPPVLEFAYPNQKGTYALYSFVRWEGETRIKLKVDTRRNGKRDVENFNTEAVRTKTGWQVGGPLPGRSHQERGTVSKLALAARARARHHQRCNPADPRLAGLGAASRAPRIALRSIRARAHAISSQHVDARLDAAASLSVSSIFHFPA